MTCSTSFGFLATYKMVFSMNRWFFTSQPWWNIRYIYAFTHVDFFFEFRNEATPRNTTSRKRNIPVDTNHNRYFRFECDAREGKSNSSKGCFSESRSTSFSKLSVLFASIASDGWHCVSKVPRREREHFQVVKLLQASPRFRRYLTHHSSPRFRCNRISRNRTLDHDADDFGNSAKRAHPFSDRLRVNSEASAATELGGEKHMTNINPELGSPDTPKRLVE